MTSLPVGVPRFALRKNVPPLLRIVEHVVTQLEQLFFVKGEHSHGIFGAWVREIVISEFNWSK